MACGTFTESGIPAEQLENAIALWKASTPTPSVTSTRDAEGTFTVKAVFPDCPPGVTHDTTGSGPAAAGAG